MKIAEFIAKRQRLLEDILEYGPSSWPLTEDERAAFTEHLQREHREKGGTGFIHSLALLRDPQPAYLAPLLQCLAQDMAPDLTNDLQFNLENNDF